MANILYRKQKQQKSLDNGVTWIDTGEYRVGNILENPSNCTSDDSKQCRWTELPATEGYYCDGYKKYTVQVEECSENGIIWTRTGNQKKGNTLIENYSSECGYVLGECDLKVVRVSINNSGERITSTEIEEEATDFILSDEYIEELELYNTKCLTYVDFRNNSDLYKINTNEWTTDNLEYLRISNCRNLTYLDLSSWNTSNLNYLLLGSINLGNQALGCINFGNNFDTSNITDMSFMFGNDFSLTSLDLNSFNTSKVTNMGGMFSGCYSLREIKGIENFNTSNVTNMGSMFGSCKNLYGYLDLSGWDTSNVTSVANMFDYCPNLISLKLSGWNLTNLEVGMLHKMFANTNIRELDLSGWDLSGYDNSKYQHWDVFPSTIEKIIITNCNEATIDVLKEILELCDISENVLVENESLSYTKKYICVTPTDTTMSFIANTSSISINVNEMTYRFYSSTKNDDGYYIYDVEIPACTITNIGSNNGFDDRLSSDYENIITITNIFDATNVITMKGVFDYFINLKSLNLNNFNTSNVTTMEGMFAGCDAITSIEFGDNFDTSNVTDMSDMFGSCDDLPYLDLSSFNTSNVTDMSGMFKYCRNLTSLDLSSFDTSNLINVNEMFYDCDNLTELNVTGWDISKIENYTDMFYSCGKLNKLILGDVEPYEYAWWCTRLTEANITCDIIVSNYTRQSEISFTFEVSNTLSGYKTIFKLNETDYSATTANSIDNGDGTYTYTATLGELNINSLTSCYSTFSYHSEYGYAKIKEINNFPDTSSVTTMGYMFNNCSGLTSLNLSSWNVSSVMTMWYMFWNCKSLTTLNLSNWNTSNVTIMEGMFADCYSLTSLDLSSFDTSNVTTMVGMFDNCSGLTEVDLSNFDTSNVTAMNGMFDGCSGLTEVDLSNFDTSNTTQMLNMFRNCTSLTSLNLSNWDMSNVTINNNNDYMFYNSNNLTTIYCYNCNQTTINKLNSVKPSNCTLVY